MRQLLETMAEMQQHGLAVDEQAKLSTAKRKTLRELVRSRFVHSLADNEVPIRRSEKAPARAAVRHGRTERGAQLARYFEESRRFTPSGALEAFRAALKTAGR